jgi:hypothetical protein
MVAAMSELSGFNDLCGKGVYLGDIREDTTVWLHCWMEIHHAGIPYVTMVVKITTVTKIT